MGYEADTFRQHNTSPPNIERIIVSRNVLSRTRRKKGAKLQDITLHDRTELSSATLHPCVPRTSTRRRNTRRLLLCTMLIVDGVLSIPHYSCFLESHNQVLLLILNIHARVSSIPIINIDEIPNSRTTLSNANTPTLWCLPDFIQIDSQTMIFPFVSIPTHTH